MTFQLLFPLTLKIKNQTSQDKKLLYSVFPIYAYIFAEIYRS